MDSHVVQSVPFPPRKQLKYEYFDQMITEHWCHDNRLYQKYSLRAKHFQYFVINSPISSVSNLKIWDGPSKTSNLLEGSILSCHQFQYISAAFLVTVSHTAKKHMANRNINISIHSSVGDTLLANQQTKQIHLPLSDNKSGKALHFSVVAPPIYSLNLTFSQYESSGDDIYEHCNFAGVAAYNVFPNNTFELITVECVKTKERSSFAVLCQGSSPCWCRYKPQCKSVLTFIHKIDNKKYEYPGPTDSKSVFSSTSTLFLTWYSFRNYGDLSVNVSFSTTTCKVIISKECHLELNLDSCAIVQVLSGLLQEHYCPKITLVVSNTTKENTTIFCLLLDF